MRLSYIILFLDLISRNLAIKTIEFVEKNIKPTLELSSGVLENNSLIKVPEHFILCSSHFELHYDTNSIYTLYQDENMTIQWFNIGFFHYNQLWVNVMHQDGWQHLGDLESQDLFEWIHICLEIDMVKETMSAGMNGKKYDIIKVAGINPSIDLSFNIKLGIVHTSKHLLKHQFHGKITNIHLYLPIVDDIANLTKNLCIYRADIGILSWSDMKWKFSGNRVKVLETDSNLICPTSTYADLTIPLKWTKGRAVDMCSKLGNGKISTFHTNASKDNNNECSGYWTPYLYSLMEGIVTNEITKLEEELLWWPGYPKNSSGFSTIMFSLTQKYFWNMDKYREECLICNTSLKTEYTLRGNCKYSFLGNFDYKANNFNKYLGFFGKSVIIW